MIIPQSFLSVFAFIEFLITNLSTILDVIPKLIQIIGLSGCLWQAWHIYSDMKWQIRSRNFFRAILTWIAGLLLEIIIEYLR